MIKSQRLIRFLIIGVIVFSFTQVFIQGKDIKFSKPLGYVSDYARILSPAQNNLLTNLIGELERKTSAEVAVVTIDTLAGISIEEYAVNLFEQWGIGKKGEDNGILLLVAMKERKVRIEVGYGLEGTITDGTAGKIIHEKIVPSFKNGDYEEGLFNATITIANLIAKSYGVELSFLQDVSSRDYEISTSSRASRIIGNLLFILFILIFVGFRWFFFPLFLGRGYWYSGRGGFGGGFGGFGGGSSGGGGASGSW